MFQHLSVYLWKQNHLVIKTLVIILGTLFALIMTGCDDGCVNCPPKCVHNNLYNSNVNKEQYVELKEKIVAVQSENDKRFVVFLWGIGLLIPTIGLIVAFTINNNNKIAAQNAQETAKKEFIKEFKVYKRKFNETFRDIEKKKEEIEILKFDIEQSLEIIKAANIASSQIKVTKDENGNTDIPNA